MPLSNTTTPADISLSRKKILLPVWLLTHRVKDRICYAAVNGTNGDVAADIPLDRGKYLKVSLIAAAVIATVLNIFLTVKPQPFLWISMAITTVFGILLGRLTQDVYVRENHLDDIGRIDLDFLAELGEHGIPFALILTKCDKQGPNVLAAQMERDREILLQQWEELPPVFCSSSQSGRGREEILDYIGNILDTI